MVLTPLEKKLKIDNEDVKIQTTIDVVQNNIFATVVHMFSAFTKLIQSKEIKVKQTDAETQEILNTIDTNKVMTIHQNETE